MIIVAGHLRVSPTNRERFIQSSCEAMRIARATPGCLDFAVGPDPLDDGRVNVYERWVDRQTMQKFRGAGPTSDLRDLIEKFAVDEFEVSQPASDAR